MKALLLALALAGPGCAGAQTRAAADAASTAAAQLVADQSCPTAAAGLALRLPRPEGFQFVTERHGCTLYAGASMQEAQLVVRADAIPSGDSGPERLLNMEPDGAARWLTATGILGTSAQTLPEGGELTLLGSPVRYYRLTGELGGLGPREVAVARVRRGSTNVVVMAIYPVRDAGRLAEALRIARAITAP